MSIFEKKYFYITIQNTVDTSESDSKNKQNQTKINSLDRLFITIMILIIAAFLAALIDILWIIYFIDNPLSKLYSLNILSRLVLFSSFFIPFASFLILWSMKKINLTRTMTIFGCVFGFYTLLYGYISSEFSYYDTMGLVDKKEARKKYLEHKEKKSKQEK